MVMLGFYFMPFENACTEFGKEPNVRLSEHSKFMTPFWIYHEYFFNFVAINMYLYSSK